MKNVQDLFDELIQQKFSSDYELDDAYDHEVENDEECGMSLGEASGIILYVDDEEHIKFTVGGKIYVRGELVDDNVEVYQAFKNWLGRTGYYTEDNDDI